MQIMKMQLSN